VTLLSLNKTEAEFETHTAGEAAVRHDEKAGYGNFIVCGCGGYSDDGTGDCRCGHSFGQHYS
jgi:hypothetical protein